VRSTACLLNLPARRCWQAALSNTALSTWKRSSTSIAFIKESLTQPPRNTLKGEAFAAVPGYLQIHSRGGFPIAQKVELRQPVALGFSYTISIIALSFQNATSTSQASCHCYVLGYSQCARLSWTDQSRRRGRLGGNINAPSPGRQFILTILSRPITWPKNIT
jgi:hypothetical protein